jgi:hypothetical protein
MALVSFAGFSGARPAPAAVRRSSYAVAIKADVTQFTSVAEERGDLELEG